MYERLLLPVDENTVESEVLHGVSELADWADAEVTVLYVADTTRDSVTMSGTDVVDALTETGDSVVDEVGDVFETLGVDYETSILQGQPAPTIVDHAESEGFDLVVMPTRGRRGLSRYLLGSVTEKVVRLASTPVMTIHQRNDEEVAVPFENLLVATDGSDEATRAAAHGVELAAAHDATLHVLAVVEETSTLSPVTGGSSDEETERAARNAVDDVVADAEARGQQAVRRHVIRGDPHEEILAAVDRRDADVVVMGTTGRQGVDRILLGSVAEKTVRSASVPVVTVSSDE